MLLVPTHNISQGSHAGLSDTIRQACCSTLSNSRLGSQLYMCCSPRWLNRKNLVNHSEQWKTSLHRPLFYMSSKQWVTNRTVSSPTFHCVLWHLHKDHMRTMFFFFSIFFWEEQVNQLVYHHLISRQRNVAQRGRRLIFRSYFLELCWHPIHSPLYRSL